MTEAWQQGVDTRAVGLKLPPFWSANPDEWFAEVEAQFSTRRITAQKTKYDHVVASLSPEFATELCDTIRHVPENPYDTLKAKLYKHICPPERRLQQLVHASHLNLCGE
jgi:hypothetical protein